MEDFREWLKANKYAESTIKELLKVIGSLEIYYESTDLQNLRYEDLINYIENLQGKVKAQTINQRLTGIRLYYSYLKEEGLVHHNVAQKVYVKNIKQSLPVLLKEEELENLYTNYAVNTASELERKILLGLLIYQGSDLGTVKNLESKDISLDKSEIYLPGNKRMNSRRLSIKGNQILLLARYLENREGRLFTEKKYLVNRYEWLKKDLKKLNKKVESIRQIRSSVITNWLRTYNLREVQYYVGHKHISSTEKYKRMDLEEMKSDLRKYHLLG